MTDNERIKAFDEYCKSVVDGYYEHISHGGEGDEHEETHIDMICGVRDVINRLKAKIEALQKANESFSCMGKMYSEIKSEGRKEFAERLKCGVPQETGVIRCADIDKLLAEMEERE